jgi:elongation factor Ts
VARNDKFQAMVKHVADVALASNGDLAATLAATYPGTSLSVEAQIKELVGTIGEHMNLRRVEALSVSDGVVATYVHNSVAEGMGKIGVLVGLESTGDKEKLNELGRQIAMHVAATNPVAAVQSEVDPALVERERQVFTEQAKESGKPDNIIEKMVEGRIRKFYQEVVLVSQSFVIDPDKTVEEAIKASEASVGAPIKLVGFKRVALGDGIEKVATDFAAEVAAAVSGS